MIGEVTLRLDGRDRIIQGGPFGAYEQPAIGVCLEVRSALAGQAALLFPVPDFGAPDLQAFAAALGDLMTLMDKQPDLPIYIGCRAGIGRTGMMIAALAKIAGQDDPVAWTRAQYHPDAVETVDQCAAVAMLDMS